MLLVFILLQINNSRRTNDELMIHYRSVFLSLLCLSLLVCLVKLQKPCGGYIDCNVTCGALQYNNDNIAYLGANNDAGYAFSFLPLQQFLKLQAIEFTKVLPQHFPLFLFDCLKKDFSNSRN